MSLTITVTDQDEAPGVGQVSGRRMSLSGDPQDMLIDESCRSLPLPAFRERFIGLATAARRGKATYKQFLLDMLQAELADRDLRRRQRPVRLARFPPAPKWLEDFDFEKNPNVVPEIVVDPKSPIWVREGRPLVLISDFGTGKPRLLTGIGTALAETFGPPYHPLGAGQRPRRS
ncbi:ATP-binding protein [Streptomyces sp. NPDC051014]|uniref:ATP-binding protein n=1 Tax=Streptomyces sp. NPDC051014 TaxID=3155751 RepID=UPI0033EE10FE